MSTELEADLHDAHAAGAYDHMARTFLEHHGRSIFFFLSDRFANREDAREAYSRFVEDFWRGLPKFEGRASLRSWAFALARSAALHHGREVRRRMQRDRALPSESQLPARAESVRKETDPYRRSEIQERLRELRKQLSEEDQTLLVLRVDQRLSWSELVTVFHRDVTDEAARRREAARLRQQFQRVKQRLRRMAEHEGLLPAVSEP